MSSKNSTNRRNVLNIFFPHFEQGKSKENRLVSEGLRLHTGINWVTDPDDVDYLFLLQNHLHKQKPYHQEIMELSELFRNNAILLDYDDWSNQVYDNHNFNWSFYFKRSIVDKQRRVPAIIHFDSLHIEHISYAASYRYLAREVDLSRSIDVACLFNSDTINHEFNSQGRGRVLNFLRKKAFPGKITLFDTVSADGEVGRSVDCPIYLDTLKNTKILITCNPSRWEGDSRLWEALASGCLVFVDRMLTPILDPLIDYQHLVYYDLSDAGLDKMYKQILYYLDNVEMRERIGNAGYVHVKNNHMSVNRIQQVINRIKSCNVIFD